MASTEIPRPLRNMAACRELVHKADTADAVKVRPTGNVEQRGGIWCIEITRWDANGDAEWIPAKELRCSI
jgi:hypothetical protein